MRNNNCEYDTDTQSSGSGKSEFDEEYYHLKPPTIPIDNQNTIIVKAEQYTDLLQDLKYKSPASQPLSGNNGHQSSSSKSYNESKSDVGLVKSSEIEMDKHRTEPRNANILKLSKSYKGNTLDIPMKHKYTTYTLTISEAANAGNENLNCSPPKSYAEVLKSSRNEKDNNALGSSTEPTNALILKLSESYQEKMRDIPMKHKYTTSTILETTKMQTQNIFKSNAEEHRRASRSFTDEKEHFQRRCNPLLTISETANIYQTNNNSNHKMSRNNQTKILLQSQTNKLNENFNFSPLKSYAEVLRSSEIEKDSNVLQPQDRNIVIDNRPSYQTENLFKSNYARKQNNDSSWNEKNSQLHNAPANTDISINSHLILKSSPLEENGRDVTFSKEQESSHHKVSQNIDNLTTYCLTSNVLIDSTTVLQPSNIRPFIDTNQQKLAMTIENDSTRAQRTISIQEQPRAKSSTSPPQPVILAANESSTSIDNLIESTDNENCYNKMRNEYETDTQSGSSVSSGKSEFDEEYYNLKPPTIPINNQNTVTVKIKAEQYSDLLEDLKTESSANQPLSGENGQASSCIVSSTFHNNNYAESKSDAGVLKSSEIEKNKCTQEDNKPGCSIERKNARILKSSQSYEEKMRDILMRNQYPTPTILNAVRMQTQSAFKSNTEQNWHSSAEYKENSEENSQLMESNENFTFSPPKSYNAFPRSSGIEKNDNAPQETNTVIDNRPIYQTQNLFKSNCGSNQSDTYSWQEKKSQLHEPPANVSINSHPILKIAPGKSSQHHKLSRNTNIPTIYCSASTKAQSSDVVRDSTAVLQPSNIHPFITANQQALSEVVAVNTMRNKSDTTRIQRTHSIQQQPRAESSRLPTQPVVLAANESSTSINNLIESTDNDNCCSMKLCCF